jgi:KAP family P-loop domain
MMSTKAMAPPTRGDDHESAEEAVLEAVSKVVADYLCDRAASPPSEPDPAPILIQIDGPGRSQFLDKLGRRLDPPDRRKHAPARAPTGVAGDDNEGPHCDDHNDGQDWTAIRFDAWQYQRLSPPWWWLMSVIDKQISARCRARGTLARARQRSRDMWERLMQLGRDLLWVLPGALVFLVGWELQAQTVFHVLKWLVTAAGGIAAAIALLSSIRNALMRHLLAGSPRGTKVLLRTTDPMADLLRRYAFLIRSTQTGMIVLIDNLDRCHAEYVVEMLEGIQTLLSNLPESDGSSSQKTARHPRVVAFVVAADRGWLCDSFLHVYEDFAAGAHEPGRPFGLAFLDKIFEFALRIPTVPAAMSLAARADGRHNPLNPFQKCTTEFAIRLKLREWEERPGARRARGTNVTPVPALRKHAVEQLAEIELKSDPRRQPTDTSRQLDQLLAVLDPGPAVQRQVATAYCVTRTTQLLAGHAVDADEHAISRLGLWTILELKWPLLANHLSRCPDDLEHIARHTAPGGIDADLKLVFDDPMARQLTSGVCGVKLTAADIEQFTTPLPCRAQPLTDFERSPAAA